MNALQSLVLGAVISAALGACPTGWKSFGQNCYLYSKGKATWMDARVMCRIVDADLIVIDSAAEQAEFKKVAETYNHVLDDDGFWLGATDWEVEGKWVWEATGHQFSYSNWGNTQPNNRNGSENCLAAVKYFDYAWSDEFCDWDNHINFVCEKAETSTPLVG
ncbi:hypothetical protein ACF0H5_000963 [Mactra antiquata]